MIQYEGQTWRLEECTILDIFAIREDLRRICFAAVKNHVLDPCVGHGYVSSVEDRPNYDDWLRSVADCVAESCPPLISIANPGGGSHIGAVIEANEETLRIHDPAVGDFRSISLQEISQIRRNDYLKIRPRSESRPVLRRRITLGNVYRKIVAKLKAS
jgi:hypothetical protein